MSDNKLTEKQQKFFDVFVEALENGVPDYEARKLAKEAAGYSENTTYHFIMQGSLNEAIIDWANRSLALRLPKAINKLDHVMDNPDEKGTANLLASINTVFDRAGVTKKESKEVTIKAPIGVVILPPKAALDEQPVSEISE